MKIAVTSQPQFDTMLDQFCWHVLNIAEMASKGNHPFINCLVSRGLVVLCKVFCNHIQYWSDLEQPIKLITSSCWLTFSVCNMYRVATFRFRLNSLCFPCAHGHFPCVFQYVNNKYYFYKWPPPPLTAILSSFLFNNNITS